jgi:hypothetical protein
MTILTPWLEITISGAVYSTALILILLSFAGKNDLKFISKISSFSLSISILLVFVSYVIGLSAHLITQQIISWLCSSSKYDPKELLAIKNFSKDAYDSLTYTYSNLVMFRHLTFSTFILSLSFLFWSRNILIPRNIKWTIFFSCIFFSLIFLWAYSSQREFLITLTNSLSGR